MALFPSHAQWFGIERTKLVALSPENRKRTKRKMKSSQIECFSFLLSFVQVLAGPHCDVMMGGAVCPLLMQVLSAGGPNTSHISSCSSRLRCGKLKTPSGQNCTQAVQVVKQSQAATPSHTQPHPAMPSSMYGALAKKKTQKTML